MPVLETVEVCVLNDPLSVATHGLLDNSIGIATMGEIISITDVITPPVIDIPPTAIGRSNLDPGLYTAQQEWYYRKDKDSPLVGPYTYVKADHDARWWSRQEISEGVVEVVSFVGDRAGDPAKAPTPSQLKVSHIYVRGKKTLSGRMAAYNSAVGIPKPLGYPWPAK